MEALRLSLTGRIVNFIGREGAGKSDIAIRLADCTRMPVVPTGDMIRRLAKEDTSDLGDKCRAMFAADAYLDGISLLGVLESGLQDRAYANGFIVDGGLRTIEETEGYRRMLKRANRDLPITVIQLEVSEEIGAMRIVGRNRPGRKQDTLESVRERHKNYRYQLEERLDLIRQLENCELIEIDASGTLEVNFGLVCQALAISS